MAVSAEPTPIARPAQPGTRAPSRTRSIAGRVLRVAVICLGAYFAFCVALIGMYRFVNPPITGVQLERRVEAFVARKPYHIRRTFVPYAKLPDHVGRAVVSAEDGRFWTHSGFDFAEMRDAGSELLDGDIPRGASTISQQLMKNLFGTTSRNPVRKVLEMALTPVGELFLGKERILELYLNNVEWAPGVFGIDAAARHYYGTSARGLSRTQAAGLAALLPNPLSRTPDNTGEYRGEILRRMSRHGW